MEKTIYFEKNIIELNLHGRGKKNHLYTNPPSSMTDEWTWEDNALFIQLMNITESKIQDLVMYASTMKEMSDYF